MCVGGGWEDRLSDTDQKKGREMYGGMSSSALIAPAYEHHDPDCRSTSPSSGVSNEDANDLKQYSSTLLSQLDETCLENSHFISQISLVEVECTIVWC
jgi:hypothetical protein